VSRVVCLHVLFQILYLDHVEGEGRLLFVYGFAVIPTSESHQMSKNKKVAVSHNGTSGNRPHLTRGHTPLILAIPLQKLGHFRKDEHNA
jgi:hypothetical protein